MSKTATKTGRRSNLRTYDQLIKYTELPLAKRPELAIGRGGAKVRPRNFHLTAEKLEKLRTAYKETGEFPNPYNHGFYHYIVAALSAMGLDEAHGKGRVFQKVRHLMSAEDTKDATGQTAWERFESKTPRAESGLDADGRFDQNVTVLQRLGARTPYGRKLLQVCKEVLGTNGGVIDILVNEAGNQQLRLNTNSETPINQTKVRRLGSPSAIAAEEAAAIAAEEAAAKAAAKGSKEAAKGSKPKKTRKIKVEKIDTPATEVDTTADQTETDAAETVTA